MGKRVNWHLVVGLGAGLMLGGYSLVSVVGCSNATSTDPRPAASQLKEGVNLLDVSNPSWGMNAAHMKGGRVVYVESRVGPMKPEVYRQSWPSDPVHEMDLRFLDQNGNTFYIMRGGDTFNDPSWAADIAKTTPANRRVSKADRDLDWTIAKEAGQALAVALPAEFKDHAFHLASFGAQPTPAENPVMQAKEARIRSTPLPSGDTAYGNFTYNNWSWFETDKYSGTTSCVAWACERHSATLMWDDEWNGSSSNWVAVISANNHGRDYTQLSYDCYSNGGWFAPGATISGSTASDATGAWDGQGGCQTAYSWSSNNNAHLCNDDAAYELWQAKSGGMSTAMGNNISFWWGTSSNPAASGWGGSFGSVGDFSCSYPSGDWNTPNCP